MNQQQLYKELGIHTDEELLHHFPVRYESLRPTPIPFSPVDGAKIVTKGVVIKLTSFHSSGRLFIRFSLKTFTSDVLSFIIYNQDFYLAKLSAKKEVLVTANYSLDRKCYVVKSILDLDSYYAITGIRPIYSLPKTVSSSYFSSVVKKILSNPTYKPLMISAVPEKYVMKYRLSEQFEAYRAVHLPRDEKNLHSGLRVFKYEEALSYSIKALAMKRQAESFKKKNAKEISHTLINSFVSALPYKLTKDQLFAIREIVTDMEDDKVMYRLLQGDVGTGKTLVAFLALYANSLRLEHGVFVAPTFELARQHYQNALKIFSSYDIEILFLGGNTKVKEKREILEKLQGEKPVILISTHAVFYDSVSFSSLGLAVVDEQQRFGVEQRNKILEKSQNTDVLMMTATPIPRTLSQIVNADLDVSTLEQFPSGKRDVRTKVITSQDPVLHKAIALALEAKRQIFVVVPKIDDNGKQVASVKSVYQDLAHRYGGDNVALLHGRIKKEDQDKIIEAFTSGKRLILVSTTVIEVGIDVSNAGLLVIFDANYFGLSSLHQLRGRIGRNGDFALALLVYDGKEKEAIDKLQFLAQNDDGLKISEYDLKMRGSGSYSGTMQTGKSELNVCNFVEDYELFKCAKADAVEILDNPAEESNNRYLKSLNYDLPNLS